MRQFIVVSAVFAAWAFTSSQAFGQFGESLRISQYRNQTSARSTTTAILSRPTVSPYLALADINGTGQIDTSQNYFTQVRPRLERQHQQRQQQRQIQQIQQNMASMRSAVARQSQTGARITGHPTRFNYYLQYYPTLNRQ